MSEIIRLQNEFCYKAGHLIGAAENKGIPLRFGHAWRDHRVYKIVRWAFEHGYSDGLPQPKCHPTSQHFDRLAVDFITKVDADHAELHRIWSAMGGAPAIPGDAGHYSVARGGMR